MQTDTEWEVVSGDGDGDGGRSKDIHTYMDTRGHARTNGSHIRKLRLSCPRHKVTFAPKSIKYFYTPKDSHTHPHPDIHLLQMPELSWEYLHVNGAQRRVGIKGKYASGPNGKLFTQVISIF